MTARRGRWAGVAALTVATVAGAGMAAAPASAHTPEWKVDCSSVSVDLTNYDADSPNTVEITADGKEVLPVQEFGKSFQKKLDLPEHSEEMEVRLIVVAGDDDKFSRDETKTSPVCDDETPPPSPSTSPSPSGSASPSPSTSAPASPSGKPSSSAPAAEPAGGGDSPAPADLAETGSSNNTLVLAGVAGTVVLAGAGMVVVARKRRSARD
ncbi:LAETG motif-containing sortase-dependent surface protein [Streptomyces sp. NPDC054796]